MGSVFAFIRKTFAHFKAFLTRMGWIKSIASLAAIIILLVGIVKFAGGSKSEEIVADQTPQVEVASVAELSQNIAPLSVVGLVSSVSEATVRAERSGEVTSVNYALGSYVSAGSVIAQMENSSERAAVLQAQGVVDAATASQGSSQTSLSGAKDSAVASLLSAFGAVESSVHSDADLVFSNPQSNQPQMIVQTSNSQAKTDAQNQRVALEKIIARQKARATTLTPADDLASEFTKTEAELRVVRDFFDTLISALNSGVAANGVSDSDIASYKASATAGRSAVTASLSAAITARQTLESATQNGTQVTGTSASAAMLKQAQGALAAAQANLEKTIIRAPISGTINSLSLKRGDFVQASSPVVTVANNGALEIKAYITDTDAREIKTGSTATIASNSTATGAIVGVITRIAPALDPLTHKIEVRIGITKGANLLINGQSVVVSVARQSPIVARVDKITIPISAIKLGSDETIVFTVDENSKLKANPVTLGALLGDRVTITGGVTSDMKIVIDARGLREGQTVIIK